MRDLTPFLCVPSHVHLCNPRWRDRNQAVSPRRQWLFGPVRVHLCKPRRGRSTRARRTPSAVSLALLLTVALSRVGVVLTVAAPVVGVVLAPAPLRRCLVGPVVGIRLELCTLPASPARALTGGLGAVTLLGDIAPRHEQAAAGRTPPLGHGTPPGWGTAYRERRRFGRNRQWCVRSSARRCGPHRLRGSGSSPRVPGGSLRERVNGLCLAGGLEAPAAGRPCAGEATRSSTLPVASGAPLSPFSPLLLQLVVVAPQAAEAAGGRARRSVGKG